MKIPTWFDSKTDKAFGTAISLALVTGINSSPLDNKTIYLAFAPIVGTLSPFMFMKIFSFFAWIGCLSRASGRAITFKFNLWLIKRNISNATSNSATPQTIKTLHEHRDRLFVEYSNEITSNSDFKAVPKKNQKPQFNLPKPQESNDHDGNAIQVAQEQLSETPDSKSQKKTKRNNEIADLDD